MTARSEVVALLIDFDVERDGAHQRFVHRDGRPFTAAETELIGTATDEDVRAAARQMTSVPQRLSEMIAPYIEAAAEGSAAEGSPAEDSGERRPPAGA